MVLTIEQIQANLQQILTADHPLSAEQRYALKSAIDAFQLIQALHPGLRSAMEQMKNAKR
jgi:hypothetical protein